MGEGVPFCHSDIQTCDGFDDGTGGFWKWTGLRETDNTGQLCGCCCDVGCESCIEVADVVGGMRASRDGKRWMRPARFVEGRDALGLVHDLRSNAPHRVQPVMAWDKAACHDEQGLECYGTGPDGLCQCDDHVFACTPGEDNCPGGGGSLCSGLFSDVYTYMGSHWNAGSTHVRCRETREKEDILIRGESPRLFQAIFVNDDWHEPLHKAACTTNRMVLCYGVRRGEAGLCTEGPPNPGEHFVGEDRQIFNWCNIAWDGIGLDFPVGTQAEAIALTVRNQALTVAAGLPALGQLDFIPSIIGENTSANAFLDHWRRDWGHGLTMDQRLSLARVATLGGCRLRRYGLPVMVEVFIKTARVEMSLVPQMTQEYPATPQTAAMWPSTRIAVHIELGYKATITSEETTVPRVWAGDSITLSIFNDESGDTLPQVLPLGADEIEFVNGGHVFPMPRVVDWWGYHGAFGVQEWEPIYYSESGNNTGRCCQLAYHLDGLEVRGWPTKDGQTAFTGKFKLGFTNDLWASNCCAFFPNDPLCDGGGGGGKYIPPVGEQPGQRVALPIPDGPQTPIVAIPFPPSIEVPGGPIVNPPDLSPSPFPPSAPIGDPPSLVPIPPNGFTPIPDGPIIRPPDKVRPPRPQPAPPNPPRGRGELNENDPPIFLV